MTVEQVPELVRTQSADRLATTNDHRITLGLPVLTKCFEHNLLDVIIRDAQCFSERPWSTRPIERLLCHRLVPGTSVLGPKHLFLPDVVKVSIQRGRRYPAAFLMLEKPEEFNPLLLGFLSKQKY